MARVERSSSSPPHRRWRSEPQPDDVSPQPPSLAQDGMEVTVNATPPQALIRNAQEDIATLVSDILSELTGPNDQYLRDRLLARTFKIEDSLRKALL